MSIKVMKFRQPQSTTTGMVPEQFIVSNIIRII